MAIQENIIEKLKGNLMMFADRENISDVNFRDGHATTLPRQSDQAFIFLLLSVVYSLWLLQLFTEALKG